MKPRTALILLIPALISVALAIYLLYPPREAPSSTVGDSGPLGLKRAGKFIIPKSEAGNIDVVLWLPPSKIPADYGATANKMRSEMTINEIIADKQSPVSTDSKSSADNVTNQILLGGLQLTGTDRVTINWSLSDSSKIPPDAHLVASNFMQQKNESIDPGVRAIAATSLFSISLLLIGYLAFQKQKVKP